MLFRDYDFENILISVCLADMSTYMYSCIGRVWGVPLAEVKLCKVGILI